MLWPFHGWFVATPPFLLSGVVGVVVKVFLFAVMVVVFVLSGLGVLAVG